MHFNDFAEFEENPPITLGNRKRFPQIEDNSKNTHPKITKN